jgi:uncharacterized protein YegJ (DUF2314 family)
MPEPSLHSAHPISRPRERAKFYLGWTFGLKLLILLVSRMHRPFRLALDQGLGHCFAVPFGGFWRPPLFPGLFGPSESLSDRSDIRLNETGFPDQSGASAGRHRRASSGGDEVPPKQIVFVARLAIPAAAALLLAASFSSTVLANDPNPVPKVPKGDSAMTAAFARAAAGLDGFLVKWRKPPAGAERFSVKIGLRDTPGAPGYAIVRPDSDSSTSGFVEWFWTNNLREDGTGFAAQISNDPEGLRNVSFGQTLHFKRQDIGDWMYWQNGKIVGNATACPALAHASAQEGRQMKEQYGLACD